MEDTRRRLLLLLRTWLLLRPVPSPNLADATADRATDRSIGDGRVQVYWTMMASVPLPPDLVKRFDGKVIPANALSFSRRRDCHSAAPPSTFSRCFNMDKQGGSSK